MEPEVIAYHFTLANFTEAAVEWWSKAGERAMRGSAYVEAIAHLKRALDLVEGLAGAPARRLLQLQTAYGYALLHGRGQAAPETIAAFARARELAAGVDDATAVASAYYGMWAGSYVRADLRSMREVSEVFLRDARRWPVSLEAGVAHRVFGTTRWLAGDYFGARTHLEQAIAAYDPERDSHFAPRFGYDNGVFAMLYLAWVLWPLGEVCTAVRFAENALSLAPQIGHIPTVAMAHCWTCVFAAIRRKPDQACSHAAALVDNASKNGLPVFVAFGIFFLGWARGSAGCQNGEARMREGMAMLRELDFHFFQPLMETMLAELEAETGCVEGGLAAAEAALATIERTGERWFEAEAHRLRGELLLKRQPLDVHAAEAAFLCSIEIARVQQTRTFELRAALSLARLHQATGRAQAARELLSPAVAGFIEGPELPEVAEANRLLASLEQMFGAA
jgi:predicted ATPase